MGIRAGSAGSAPSTATSCSPKCEFVRSCLSTCFAMARGHVLCPLAHLVSITKCSLRPTQKQQHRMAVRASLRFFCCRNLSSGYHSSRCGAGAFHNPETPGVVYAPIEEPVAHEEEVSLLMHATLWRIRSGLLLILEWCGLQEPPPPYTFSKKNE